MAALLQLLPVAQLTVYDVSRLEQPQLLAGVGAALRHVQSVCLVSSAPFVSYRSSLDSLLERLIAHAPYLHTIGMVFGASAGLEVDGTTLLPPLPIVRADALDSRSKEDSSQMQSRRLPRCHVTRANVNDVVTMLSSWQLLHVRELVLQHCAPYAKFTLTQHSAQLRQQAADQRSLARGCWARLLYHLAHLQLLVVAECVLTSALLDALAERPHAALRLLSLHIDPSAWWSTTRSREVDLLCVCAQNALDSSAELRIELHLPVQRIALALNDMQLAQQWNAEAAAQRIDMLDEHVRAYRAMADAQPDRFSFHG
jgi:hypothetical protein